MYGCGEQEVGVASGSGWNLWFTAASLLFLHKFFFFVLVPVLFVIKFYVLNNFLSQYKHIQATKGVPRQPYEGCT